MNKTTIVKALTTLVVVASCILTAPAAEKLTSLNGSPLADNAVLQRDRTIPIWGASRGQPGAAVTVAFQGQEWTGVVEEDRSWRVEIGPLKAHPKNTTQGDELTCTVAGSTTVLKNVLVGDVWLCVGQSNMERGLGKAEDYPARVDGDTRDYPALRIDGTVCSGNFGGKALPYHFGRCLLELGDVPVGIYTATASGNPLHSFLSPVMFDRFIAENQVDIANEWQRGMGAPSTAYGALHRLAPMAVKGVFWDQGEGNTMRFPTRYQTLLDLLYAQFCEEFEQENLPFLLIHKGIFLRGYPIPEHGLPAYVVLDAFNWIGRRGIAVGMGMARFEARDPSHRVAVGNHDHRDQVHYWGKEFAGRRAAEAALGLVDGKDFPVHAPRFSKAAREGTAMRIAFDDLGQGLSPARWVVNELIGKDFATEWAKYDRYQLGKDGIVVKKVNRASDTKGFAYTDWRMMIRKLDAEAPLGGFFVVGADAVLYAATARIDGDAVVVSNPKSVPEPVYVAYGVNEGEYETWNLYGKNGLPVLPFWSGPWPPSRIPGNAWVKTFEVEPKGFAKGVQTTLKWEVAGVAMVTIEPGIGEVPAKGERTISPSEVTTYSLNVPAAFQPQLVLKGGVVRPGQKLTFKPWRTTAVPGVVPQAVTPTGEVVPGCTLRFRERDDDWQGVVIKTEPVGAPRVLFAIGKRAPEAQGRPVDLVFEGLMKIENPGLCRFRLKLYTKQLATDGNTAILEVGGKRVFASQGRDGLAGDCLFPAAGYYPMRYRVRCDAKDMINLVLNWTAPGGCDVFDWHSVDRSPGLFWRAATTTGHDRSGDK